MDELRLSCLATSCDIFGLAETWLNNDILDSEIQIPDYTVFRRDRNRHGGGVAIYVRNCLSATVVNLSTSIDLELLMIKIAFQSISLFVGVFYRPPHIADSLLNLHTALESLNPTCFRYFVLLGDFNVNLLDQSHPLLYQMTSIMNSFGLHQLITEPTHQGNTHNGPSSYSSF